MVLLDEKRDDVLIGKVLYCSTNIWSLVLTLYNKVITESLEEYENVVRKKLFEYYLKE
jgi:hypothetical protein